MNWTEYGYPIRLTGGSHAFLTDDCLVVYTPNDEFIQLTLSEESTRAVKSALSGRVTPAQALVHDPGLSEVLDALAEEGLIDLSVGPDSGLLAGKRVGLWGRNPIADEVSELLERAGVGDVIAVDEGIAVAGPIDLLIACAGWLPDSTWLEMDRHCEAANVAWTRCYGEGSRFYLGPLTCWGETASYRDLRDRLLAAADYPDLIRAYWSHIDRDVEVEPLPRPSPAVLALVAGALVHDAVAFLEGRPVATSNCQIALDPITLTWERHPVLPVPRNLMFVQEEARA